MMPYWRKLAETIEDVGKTITGLHERAASSTGGWSIRGHHRRQRWAELRRLSSSSLTQFFIAGLVMLIAIGGAVINFNLIALPMSEMVGGGSYIGPFKTSNVAGLVIILVEASMGLFLMESLRITRLFPIIGQMDDRMRRRMIGFRFSILLVLAGVESALAFMRDQIAADTEALRQTLAGAGAVVAPPQSYPDHRPDGHGLRPPLRPDLRRHSPGILRPLLPAPSSASRADVACCGSSLSVLRLIGNLVHQFGHMARHPLRPAGLSAAVVRKGASPVGKSRSRPAPAKRRCRNETARRALSAGLVSLLLRSAPTPTTHSRAVYLLMDTAGTYAQELTRPRRSSTICSAPCNLAIRWPSPGSIPAASAKRTSFTRSLSTVALGRQ